MVEHWIQHPVCPIKLNIELFPGDEYLWDSLGQAYSQIGKEDEAIKSFERALELALTDKCEWCESSNSWIEKLTLKERE